MIHIRIFFQSMFLEGFVNNSLYTTSEFISNIIQGCASYCFRVFWETCKVSDILYTNPAAWFCSSWEERTADVATSSLTTLPSSSCSESCSTSSSKLFSLCSYCPSGKANGACFTICFLDPLNEKNVWQHVPWPHFTDNVNVKPMLQSHVPE